VHIIRTGSPTIQRNEYSNWSYQGEATITPDFELFINVLKQRDLTLLFTSLQDDIERIAGSEKAQNTALKALAIRYPDTFHFMILAHDSDFYYQHGAFEQLNIVEELKAYFLYQITTSQDSFFIEPNTLAQVDFKRIMDEVHTDAFENQLKLSKQEREIFIELCYTRFTIALIDHHAASYVINCCKDSIDRAGIRNALMHYFLLLSSGKELSPENLNPIYMYLHAGALLVKKRALNERKNRLTVVLGHLEKPEVRARLSERLRGVFPCSDIGIQRVDEQREYKL